MIHQFKQLQGEDPYTVGSKNETSEFNFVEGSVLKVAKLRC